MRAIKLRGLTDNGIAFADLRKYRDGPALQWIGRIFERVCCKHEIKHKLSKSHIFGPVAKPSGQTAPPSDMPKLSRPNTHRRAVNICPSRAAAKKLGLRDGQFYIHIEVLQSRHSSLAQHNCWRYRFGAPLDAGVAANNRLTHHLRKPLEDRVARQ
ncbi:MAG: Integrase core protein [Spirosoma sp.]|nr:Integrase core protein [Spirosoma sp.]